VCPDPQNKVGQTITIGPGRGMEIKKLLTLHNDFYILEGGEKVQIEEV